MKAANRLPGQLGSQQIVKRRLMRRKTNGIDGCFNAGYGELKSANRCDVVTTKMCLKPADNIHGGLRDILLSKCGEV